MRILDRLITFRWAALGIVYFITWLLISAYMGLTHTTSTENYYTVAWTYVLLMTGVTSVIYPLFLRIRVSLTTRMFKAIDDLARSRQENLTEQDKERIVENIFSRLQIFRQRLFDRQLPFLASFSGLSVLRVLSCMMNIGPYSAEQQIIEPQMYVIGLMLWMAWMVQTILVSQPIVTLEEAEARARDLPIFEISYRQTLRARELEKERKHNQSE